MLLNMTNRENASSAAGIGSWQACIDRNHCVWRVAQLSQRVVAVEVAQASRRK